MSYATPQAEIPADHFAEETDQGDTHIHPVHLQGERAQRSAAIYPPKGSIPYILSHDAYTKTETSCMSVELPLTWPQCLQENAGPVH
jgi:hypothetical protein